MLESWLGSTWLPAPGVSLPFSLTREVPHGVWAAAPFPRTWGQFHRTAQSGLWEGQGCWLQSLALSRASVRWGTAVLAVGGMVAKSSEVWPAGRFLSVPGELPALPDSVLRPGRPGHGRLPGKTWQGPRRSWLLSGNALAESSFSGCFFCHQGLEWRLNSTRASFILPPTTCVCSSEEKVTGDALLGPGCSVSILPHGPPGRPRCHIVDSDNLHSLSALSAIVESTTAASSEQGEKIKTQSEGEDVGHSWKTCLRKELKCGICPLHVASIWNLVPLG